MEKRAIIAAVLMVGLLMVYQAWFLPAPEAPPPAADQQKEPTTPPAPAPAPATPAAPSTAPPAAVAPPPPARDAAAGAARAIGVESPLYRATVTSAGGQFREWTLKYRGDKEILQPGQVMFRGLVVMRPGSGPAQPAALTFADAEVDLTSPGSPDRELRLTGEEAGLRVTETLAFSPDEHTVDVLVRVENPGSAPAEALVVLPFDAPQAWKDVKEAFPGQHPIEAVWSDGGRVERVSNLCQTPTVVAEGPWIGIGSGGYMAALMPRSGGFKLAASGEPSKVCDAPSKEPVGRATVALQASATIPPGQAWEGKATLFVGPKEYERLKAIGLDGAIYWGCFPVPCNWGGLPMHWLGVPILKLMNWMYGYVGNYGVAIILLTVLSKVLFFPLTIKSMRSMRAMQALAPQVNALRSKYRSDPRKLQEETMALYRKHRVNPMGGCLPMAAQIPVFYALYVVLTVSAELQSAPFLCFGRVFGMDLWICDLASIDPLYILPVLMAVSMFVQQKMAPTPADPQQARMMLIMPVVFGGMFIVFPIASGLTLYWTVSNILQIFQQWYMDRPRSRGSERAAKNAARA